MRERYLIHHGIKGQEWGVRNGPPYPLSEAEHKKVVKKEKKKSFAESLWEDDDIRRCIKIGAAVAVAYAGLQLYSHKDELKFFAKAGKNYIQNYGDKLLKSKLPQDLAKAGKSFDEIDDKLVESVNGMQYFTKGAEGKNNCLLCTSTYIADTICGADYKAGLSSKGFTREEYSKIFNNVKPLYEVNYNNTAASLFAQYIPTDKKACKELKNIVKPGTTGAFNIASLFGGHAMAFECNRSGNITIVDCQIGQKFKFEDWLAKYDSSGALWLDSVYDMSNVTLKGLRPIDIRKYFN